MGIDLSRKPEGYQFRGVSVQDTKSDSYGCVGGADLKGFLGDLKPALMAPIEAEFQKNPYEVRKTNHTQPPY